MLNPPAPLTADHWNAVDRFIAGLADEQVTIRRHLHRNPEPSKSEFETTRYIDARLRAAGYEPRILRDGLGLTVDLTIGEPDRDTPRIGLRADIDALRIQDEKTSDYRSCVPGVMHACGHDGHTAIVLGAALAAQQLTKDWRGPGGLRLRFLFQPAEETSDGARWLIEQGVLEGIAAVIGMHMEPLFPAGHVGLRYGVLTAACDELRISINGHGGHAARPHQTRDPILAAAELIRGLYGIVPRRLDARSAAVISIGQIHAGNAPNAIPERAELVGTIRTIDMETREQLFERVADVCSGVATMTGTTITPEFRYAIPSVVNDDRLSNAFDTASQAVLGDDRVIHIPQPSMGGEDFAFYLQHVPGAMLRLGCSKLGQSPQYLHSSRFDIDERCLAIGSRILLRTAAVASQTVNKRVESGG